MNIDRKKKFIILLLYDIFAVSIAYYLSFYLRLGKFDLSNHYKLFIASLPVVVLTQVMTFWVLGLYKSVIRYANFSTALGFIKIVTLSILVSITVSYLFSYRSMPRSIFVIDWMLLVFLVSGVRFSFRFFNELNSILGIKKYEKKALIYGAGVCGVNLLQEIKNDKATRIYVEGFIDDDPSKVGRIVQGVKVLGTGNELINIMKTTGADDLIIAMPELPGNDLKKILLKTRPLNIIPKIVPPLDKILSGKKQIASISEISIEDLLKRSPKSLNFKEIRNFIEGKRILITGAGGSIGGELVLQIASNNPAKMVLLDINEYNLYEIDEKLKEFYPNVISTSLLVDITDKIKTDSVFEKFKPEYVFHAAAYKHVPMLEKNICSGIYNNIGGTYNVAKLADKNDVNKFILISTDKAVRPTNIMGATKKICELLVQNIFHKSSTEFVAVRFGNVLGSSGSVIPKMIKQINRNNAVTVTHPEVTRYFMLLSEAVSLVLQAASIGKNGEIFILDMGHPVNIAEMARELIYLCGKVPGKEIPITFTGLRPGEKLFEELILKDVETNTRYKDIFIAKKHLYTDELEMQIINLLESSRQDDQKAALEYLKGITKIYTNKELSEEGE